MGLKTSFSVAPEVNFHANIFTEDNGINRLGDLYLYREKELIYVCHTLELAYKLNRNRISAIPHGNYLAKRRLSPKFGMCWRIYEPDGVRQVVGRKEILIHPANYASSDPKYKSDLKGCIALGKSFGDLNNDGILEILQSRTAQAEFDAFLKGTMQFTLTIKPKPHKP